MANNASIPLLDRIKDAARHIEPEHRNLARICMNEHTQRDLTLAVNQAAWDYWESANSEHPFTVAPPLIIPNGRAVEVYGVRIEIDAAIPDGEFTVIGGAA